MPCVVLLKSQKGYEDIKISISPFCPSDFLVNKQLSSTSSSNIEIFLLSMSKLMAAGDHHHLQQGQQAATKIQQEAFLQVVSAHLPR